MAFRKVKDLAVVTGSCTDRDGNEKKRYANIGAMMESDNGPFLMLNAHFNPAGVPRKDGSESILVSMFDPKERDASGGQQRQPEQRSQQRNDPFAGDLDEDIPF